MRPDDVTHPAWFLHLTLSLFPLFFSPWDEGGEGRGGGEWWGGCDDSKVSKGLMDERNREDLQFCLQG